jgi:hypothetical protein
LDETSRVAEQVASSRTPSLSFRLAKSKRNPSTNHPFLFFHPARQAEPSLRVPSSTVQKKGVLLAEEKTGKLPANGHNNGVNLGRSAQTDTAFCTLLIDNRPQSKSWSHHRRADVTGTSCATRVPFTAAATGTCVEEEAIHARVHAPVHTSAWQCVCLRPPVAS